MATVQVRYIVRDVDAAIAFYGQQLGFQTVMHPAPAFAMLSRGDLRLVLSAPNPSAGGGQAMRRLLEAEHVAATIRDAGGQAVAAMCRVLNTRERTYFCEGGSMKT